MRFTLCLEQTLGHRAHAQNLSSAVSESDHEVDVLGVDFLGRFQFVPWAIRGSFKAARQFSGRGSIDDARFFHTQCVSLFAPLISHGRPYVVSIDATPKQMDEMGRWYQHNKSIRVAERLKQLWYKTVFRRAAAMVAWSNWAADSLTAQYGVPRERILVAHPGAGRDFFELPPTKRESGKATILFVGGDLHRKGGDTLLAAFAQLSDRVDLVMVTPEPVETRPGLTVVHGALPGSRELLDAYERADIFCLPTRGDCTPLVLGEAMAAGLPVITTRVGSNAETVTDGVDGILIEPNSVQNLLEAVTRLVDDPPLRWKMGRAARHTASARFDAAKNAHKILGLLRAVAR